jgi:hypothetical protein
LPESLGSVHSNITIIIIESLDKWIDSFRIFDFSESNCSPPSDIVIIITESPDQWLDGRFIGMTAQPERRRLAHVRD